VVAFDLTRRQALTLARAMDFMGYTVSLQEDLMDPTVVH
jgi:hypothetical protein